MKIFRVMISDGQSLSPYTAIEYEGKLWLVSSWIEKPEEGYIIPARLIRFDDLGPRPCQIPGFPYQLSKTIPRTVLDGIESRDYEVLEDPPLQIQIHRGIH